jgi:hypothetical protein
LWNGNSIGNLSGQSGGGGGGDVYWSQLYNTNQIYNQLINNNFEFGIKDNGSYPSPQYSSSLNINSNFSGNLSVSNSPYLKVGDDNNSMYTLVTNVNSVSEPNASSYTTMATINTDMHLYADKASTSPFGGGDMYLYAKNVIPGNYQSTNYSASNLGTNNLPWGTVNSFNFNTVSDIKLKENIEPLDSNYSISLVKKIDTVSYNFKSDKDKKIHLGVIAQQIKEIIGDADLALHTDGDTQAVCYTQLIAPLIKTVQNLLQRVEELELKESK